MNAWVADQQAAGAARRGDRGGARQLRPWDRYDFDGDGDFNEPDGYIDHFQIVHAGGDQADGDPWQGEDAIWSHRWYAYVTDVGMTGPAQNLLGGTQIGDTGIWVGDYTIQPENGGLSTLRPRVRPRPRPARPLRHRRRRERRRVLDADGPEPPVGAEGEPIGTRAGDLSAWDKLQLGWLDYEVTVAGQDRTLELGPSEYNTGQGPRRVVTCCPKKTVTFDYGAPFAGERHVVVGPGRQPQQHR